MSDRFKPYLYIFYLSASILFLELALIRWIPTEIRIFAYLKNMILLAVFLGMGLGIILGKRKSDLLNFFGPLFLLLTFLISFSKEFNFKQLQIPNLNIMVWGLKETQFSWNEAIFSFSIFLVIFVLITFVFISCASPLAKLFEENDNLNSYSADLIGSIFGVILFTALAFLDTNPLVWIAVGALVPTLMSKKKSSIIFYCLALLFTFKSVGKSTFSPYYRIDINNLGTFVKRITVDGAFLQDIYDFENGIKQKNLKRRRNLLLKKKRYDFPYLASFSKSNVLILGSGTGNDVQAAIRNKAHYITAVEIDPQIIKIGHKLHPQKPYSSSKVKVINNDARAFLKQNNVKKFDLISYGLLDSHSMFSSVSSLRLDNFVYTEEGIKDAFDLLTKNGTLHISFCSQPFPWITERIYWTSYKATGVEPLIINHEQSCAVSFLMNRNLDFLNKFYSDPLLQTYKKYELKSDKNLVRTTSDNWPFLYLERDYLPLTYLFMMFLVISFGSLACFAVLSKQSNLRNFDWPIFLMGAGFMLLETRSITAMSLIFGSTWMVNAFVFVGILFLALVANLYAKFYSVKNYSIYYLLLFLSLAFLFFFDLSSLNSFNLIIRGLIATLVMSLPIGFAGIIVSKYLKDSKDVSLSLAANILGAVFGVCLEYFSMIFGLKFLLLIAFLIYLSSFLLKRFTKNYDQ